MSQTKICSSPYFVTKKIEDFWTIPISYSFIFFFLKITSIIFSKQSKKEFRSIVCIGYCLGHMQFLYLIAYKQPQFTSSYKTIC